MLQRNESYVNACVVEGIFEAVLKGGVDPSVDLLIDWILNLVREVLCGSQVLSNPVLHHCALLHSRISLAVILPFVKVVPECLARTRVVEQCCGVLAGIFRLWPLISGWKHQVQLWGSLHLPQESLSLGR